MNGSRKLVTLALLALLVVPGHGQEEATVYEPGVDMRFYWVGESMKRVPRLVPGQTPNVNWLVKKIDISGPNDAFEAIAHQFVTICRARLEIKKEGLYEFRLTSDDGSFLKIDGLKVIDHDGLHSATGFENAVQLKAGYHDLEVQHFEDGGDWKLSLEWRPPGESAFSLIDDRVLSTPKGVVRVTAPGKKNIMAEFFETVPGDRRPLTDIHPGYNLRSIRPEDFKPKVGGLDFLPDGRLVLCCWEPEGRVFIVEGLEQGDRSQLKVKKIAEGLAEPLGLKVVDGRIFVLQKQELTELIDHDGDEIIDEYRCLCDSWHVSANFHEFAFGLVEKDGWLYFNLAIAIDPGGKSTKPQVPDRGRSARVSIETGELEFVCWGLRTPNGIGIGPEGEIFITDNQGDWLPSSKLLHLVPGSFYEQRAALPADWQEIPPSPPVVWLPQNEIGNSPGSPAFFKTGPYAGQMAVCEVTHGGVKRVFVEKVNDVYQGVVFRFSQGFEAGLNRILIDDAGKIICGGIGSTGNWGQDGKLSYGLQELTPNGQMAFEMLKIESCPDGFLITFTEPLAAGTGEAQSDYLVESFTYQPNADYGGPKRDLRKEEIGGLRVSSDRRRVFLDCAPEAGRIYYFHCGKALRSSEGRALWGTEAWYTLNQIADRDLRFEAAPATTAAKPNVLSEVEQDAGWRLLFDGETTREFRGYKSEEFPETGWIVEDGELVHVAGGGGGDIITRELFGDFEFSCDWKMAPGGNSGIMYRVTEIGHSSWVSGREYQLLDDQRHPDSADPRHRAGSLYDLMAPFRDVVRPAGEWNRSLIRVRKTRVEHWLNGILVLEYRQDSPRYAAALRRSKFKDVREYGWAERGHIALQDHGDEVRFRNIKIRELGD